MFTQEMINQLKSITDPDHLEAVGIEVADLIKSYKDENARLRKIIDDKEKAKQLSLFKPKNHRLTHILFGFGREQANALKNRLRIKTEKQLTLNTKELSKSGKCFKKVDLPINVKEHLLKEEGLVETLTLQGMNLNNNDEIECDQIKDLFETSTEITVTERTYTKTINKRAKYKVKNKTTNQEKIITAPGPDKLYSKCQFSIDFSVMCVGDKFLNHQPYERQRREMNRQNLDVPVSTMCRLERGVCIHLGDVYEEIKKDILFNVPHLAVGIDETRWLILNKTDSNGYLWVLSNAAGSFYKFEPTRSGEIAKELLQGFKGAGVSDKYIGYMQFLDKPDVTWGFCLAHARRDFISLQNTYPKDCLEVLEIMDKVFEIEHLAKTYKELAVLRETKSAPLMNELKEILLKKRDKFFNSEEMSKAIGYVLSNFKEFTNFLTDVRLPVSNNESERAMRQSVLGRKNYHGSKTIDGADQAAIMFTVVETCKKAQLDPKDYIKYVIQMNNKGETPKTPLKYALDTYGKTDAWPENQKNIII